MKKDDKSYGKKLLNSKLFSRRRCVYCQGRFERMYMTIHLGVPKSGRY